MYSQYSAVDSIKHLKEISDSERIQLHIAVAKKYIEEGLRYNKNFKDSVEIIENLNEALLLAETNKDIYGQARVLLTKAEFFRSIEDYDSLIYYAKQVLKLNKVNIPDITARANFLMSIGWKVLGNYDNAVECINRGMEACKLGNNAEQEILLVLALSEIYNEQQEYQKVIDLILPLKFKIDTTSNEKNILAFFNTLAIACKNTGRNDEAISHYNTCMQLGIVQGHQHLKAIMQTNIGLLYVQLDSLDKALQFQNKALYNARKIGSNRLLTGILINLGETYLAARQYENAIRYTKEGLDSAENLDQYFKREGEHNLALAYEAQEKYKLAYKHLKVYNDIKDSLTVIENNKLIEDLNVQYQTKLKEEEIEKLSAKDRVNQLKIAKQRLSLFIGGIIISFMVIVYIILKKNYNKQKQIIELNYEMGIKYHIANSQRSNTTIDDNLKKEILEKFEQLMQKDKLYKDSKINLNDIANNIGTNRTYLSGVINEYYNENFNTLINSFRINDARIILADPKNNIPIKALASDLGFSSLSAFYRSFKSATGITPAELRTRAINRS